MSDGQLSEVDAGLPIVDEWGRLDGLETVPAVLEHNLAYNCTEASSATDVVKIRVTR